MVLLAQVEVLASRAVLADAAIWLVVLLAVLLLLHRALQVATPLPIYETQHDGCSVDVGVSGKLDTYPPFRLRTSVACCSSLSNLFNLC